MLRNIWKLRADAFISRCRGYSNGVDCRNGSSSFAVMSFGDGSQGALGLPHSQIGVGGDAYEPTIVPGLPADVVSVSAGHYHSLAVTSEGELWAWGRNNEGQLGRGLIEPRQLWNEPKRVEGLDNVKVQSAFASGVISVALGDDGSVWTWGRSKRGQLGHREGTIEAIVPSRVEALAGEDVTKVSLGWGHVLARTIDGKLFGWGYSADGRLGRLGERVEASPLDSSANLPGRYNLTRSEVLDAAEKLVFESMEKEKDMPILWEPQLIGELHSVQVTDISCGLDHSLIISDPRDTKTFRKALFSWGWNGSCQLGRQGPENKPLEVQGMGEEIPTIVSCGRAHSLAITSNGQLLIWGCGKNGRLGLGSSFDEPEAALVDIGNLKIVQAVAGFDHNLLLVAES